MLWSKCIIRALYTMFVTFGSENVQILAVKDIIDVPVNFNTYKCNCRVARKLYTSKLV